MTTGTGNCTQPIFIPLCCCLPQVHPSFVPWESYFLFSQVCHYPPKPPNHMATAWRKKKRMLRANRINATLDGPGHLTNTDALKGAHRMICDWTKNWRDGAWAWPQDWYNMSSTGRAISSAYWKRRILPSAEGNFQCQAPVPLLWLSQTCLPFWGDYAKFQAHVRILYFRGAQRAENS